MTWRGPTYRTVDGEKINGAWCHVWRQNDWDDRYYLDDLIVFADGAVNCEEWTDLQGLAELLVSGRIAARDPGRPEPPAEPSKWLSRNSEPLTPEGFLLEVADTVEELNGRPTSRERLWDAVKHFQREPGEHHRSLLRAAYLTVPPHQRIYSLGDMDRQDRPLRILFTDIGTAVDGDGPVVTAAMHDEVLEYFRRGEQGVEAQREQRAVQHADDPAGTGRAALTLREVAYSRGWPETPGPFVLRNEYAAQVVFAGETYPSVLHGYWALSAADPAEHDAIRDAPSTDEAHERGGRAQRRADWADLRLAVMSGLLRAKFAQHPALADYLLATGDSRISYAGRSDSPYWRDAQESGRNWVGRLLELIRSELVAERVFAD